ncbi:Hypothetical protein DEACI_1444 [Acididesulfobacillus acetoxydans]|uniref:Uncharacterized protein n=1 Tax=Acididesulfobacillus acetoxydans TaxID=1561005 RepID=A0A8S0WX78_9FIRM|nr:Hypothetical protein DEACI_1444 [Acididesulfobacillus acetoxydans]CEJ08639.1 Hypothetical protein DEACI_3118 [Acididesulfobacillus acetoxydans]
MAILLLSVNSAEIRQGLGPGEHGIQGVLIPKVKVGELLEEVTQISEGIQSIFLRHFYNAVNRSASLGSA